MSTDPKQAASVAVDLPCPESLEKLFSELVSSGFLETQSQPIFTARHWSWSMESEARQRWVSGLSNISEVAVPRWYWRSMQPPDRSRMLRLSLGLSDEKNRVPPKESCLFSPTDLALQNWLLIPRFERIVLANHRRVTDRDYVYFGDDTLFLMAQARESLRALQNLGGRRELRVLDLCCGGGGVGLALPGFAGTLTGVDLNERAVSAARLMAELQGLSNYQYHLADARELLRESYDLVVGNPPTLDPELAGADVFHATGSLALFEEILKKILVSLSSEGRAVLTVFSQVSKQNGVVNDPTHLLVQDLVGDSRPYQYRVRRSFPLKNSALRHCSIHLFGCSEEQVSGFVPSPRATQLPALTWRRS